MGSVERTGKCCCFVCSNVYLPYLHMHIHNIMKSVESTEMTGK